MKKILISVIYSFLCVSTVLAQDPGFSQYYAAPLYINPAFASDKQDVNFGINSRTLTNKSIGTYSLMQLSAVVPFSADFLHKSKPDTKHYSGAGLSMYREATGANGELNTLGAFGTIAHNVQLSREHFLSLGLQAGCVYKKQGNNFNWGSQYSSDFGYDPTIIPSVDGLIDLYSVFPTFNLGMEYFYNSNVIEDYFKKNDFDAYAGFALYNVNRPNQSFFDEKEARLPINMKVNAGMKYNATNQFALFPSLLWTNQNMNNQINLGMYANVRTVKTMEAKKEIVNIIAGVWYRVGDSFITSIGCTWLDFKFAISYDFNASSFSYNNRGKGATEVSLKYSMPTKNRERYSRGLMYPAF